MSNKIIIGIVGEERLYRGKKLVIFNDNVLDLIMKNRAIPLGLLPTNIDVKKKLSQLEKDDLHIMIDSCSGVILQGGKNIYGYQIEAVNYIREKNIPVLGICLGMEIMALSAKGKKERLNDEFHRQGDSYAHPVRIDHASKLYSIIGEDEIMVNSNHICHVEDAGEYVVSSKYDEQIIEAIELPDKLFHIGVQWHPETMINYDDNMNKLVGSFFDASHQYEDLKNKQ